MCDCRNDCGKKKTYLILSLLFNIVFSQVPFEMTNKTLQVEEFRDHAMTNVSFNVENLPFFITHNSYRISPVILCFNNCFLCWLVNSTTEKKA